MIRHRLCHLLLAWMVLCIPAAAQTFQTSSAIREQSDLKIHTITVEEFRRLELLNSIVKNGPKDSAEIQALIDAHSPRDNAGRLVADAIYDREHGFLIGASDLKITIHSRYQDANGDIAVVVSGRDSSGKSVKVSQDQISVFRPDGSTPTYTFQTQEQAAPPTILEVLIDTSGSMEGHMQGVEEAVEGLLSQMPDHVRCGIITFGKQVKDYAPKGYKACKDKLFKVRSLKPEGATPLFEALKQAYSKLNSPANAKAQKAVIVLSDGAPTDEAILPKIIPLKQEVTTIFFWLGNKNSEAETLMQPLATHFVAGGDDAVAKLKEYFAAYNEAVAAQSVIVLRKLGDETD